MAGQGSLYGVNSNSIQHSSTSMVGSREGQLRPPPSALVKSIPDITTQYCINVQNSDNLQLRSPTVRQC